MSQTTAGLEARAYAEVGRSVMALVLEEPFFGHFLGGLNRVVTSMGTPTAAVAFRSARPVLLINPEFFVERLTRGTERVAVIKHEALHLLLKHLVRFEPARVDGFVYNVAADLVVNQLIGSRWTLPAGAITLDTFPSLVLEPDLRVDEYYEALMANRAEIGAQRSWHSDHGPWADSSADTDSDLAAGEVARLARIARTRSGRSYGRLAAPVRTIVDALIDELEPTIDWRRVLRMFSNSSRRTRIAGTVRRPSKRYGTFPGIKVQRAHRLVVVVDTSGSISDDDLSDFFAEIHGIWRQGSEVTVVDADQIVQRVWSYQGQRPRVVGGRTGTNFDPALQWVRDRQQNVDAVIYLTDGFAPAPTVDPACQVLWVVTPDGEDGHLRPGRAVKIKRKEP